MARVLTDDGNKRTHRIKTGTFMRSRAFRCGWETFRAGIPFEAEAAAVYGLKKPLGFLDPQAAYERGRLFAAETPETLRLFNGGRVNPTAAYVYRQLRRSGALI